VPAIDYNVVQVGDAIMQIEPHENFSNRIGMALRRNKIAEPAN
jgi:hypothetical protein